MGDPAGEIMGRGGVTEDPPARFYQEMQAVCYASRGSGRRQNRREVPAVHKLRKSNWSEAVEQVLAKKQAAAQVESQVKAAKDAGGGGRACGVSRREHEVFQADWLACPAAG